MNKEVIKMHARRKAVESLEITCYLIKHNPATPVQYKEHLAWLEKEVISYRKAMRYYAAPSSKDYIFLVQERDRIRNILNKEKRKWGKM